MHTIVDFVATVDDSQRVRLDQALAALWTSTASCDGGPFGAIDTLHFASMTVFENVGFPATLVFECNCDGTLDVFLPRLLVAAGDALHEILACCVDYVVASSNDVEAMESYLRAHAVRPAAIHVGNVGRSVVRIQREADFHRALSVKIDRWHEGSPIRSRRELYDRVVRDVKRRGDDWIFAGDYETGADAARMVAWWKILGVAGLIVALVASGVCSLKLGTGVGWRVATGYAAIAVAIVAGVVALVIRWHEMRDTPMNSADLSQTHLAELGAAEDHHRLNHLGSLTVVKDSWFRRSLLRVALFVTRLIAGTCTDGSLSGIPTVHFAHWALLDDGRRLLFLTSYDGSWASYLGEFVEKASVGLTGIWTNTLGFPRTRFLVNEGAQDGSAFKAFARMHQTPASVWYQAAPYRNDGLGVQRINANSALRIGITKGASAIDVAPWSRLW